LSVCRTLTTILQKISGSELQKELGRKVPARAVVQILQKFNQLQQSHTCPLARRTSSLHCQDLDRSFSCGHWHNVDYCSCLFVVPYLSRGSPIVNVTRRMPMCIRASHRPDMYFQSVWPTLGAVFAARASGQSGCVHFKLSIFLIKHI
jgi:hypothetical protein